MQNLKILCLQSDIVWDDPEKNRELLKIKITNHVDDHQLVILPETFSTGFPKFPSYKSETQDGPTIKWMAEVANRTGAVITGSLIIEENGQATNSLIWMRPDGNYSRYAKRHVFSMAGENTVIEKGTEPLIVELNGWKIKPMICYDLRFPVWSKNRLDEKGLYEYDLAFYVSNWPAIRAYPWTQLLLARAIENLSYVIGLNRVGRDPYGVYYSGDSMVIDPKGKVLEEPEEGKERAITADLSYSELQDFRKTFNVGVDWDNFTINS